MFAKQQLDPPSVPKRAIPYNFEDIMESIEEGYCETNRSLVLTRINRAFAVLLGYSKNELLEKNIKSFIKSSSYNPLQVAIDSSATTSVITTSDRFELLNKDGKITIVDVLIFPVVSLNDSVDDGYQFILKKNTILDKGNELLQNAVDEREYEEAIARANLMTVEAEMTRIELKQVFNTAADGMWVLDGDFNINRVNHAMLQMLGESEEHVLGKKCHAIFQNTLCHTAQCPMVKISEGCERVECDIEDNHDAVATPYILTATAFKDIGGDFAGIVESFKDNSERKKIEAALKKANLELQRLVSVDGLTQISNRRHFDYQFQREWNRSIRENEPISLIMCDVDFFKQYNDFYGHQKGDDCLRQVARAIENSAKRPADLVARYGGEEFVVVLPNTPNQGALIVANTVLKAIKRLQIPHEKSEVAAVVTLSLGVSTIVPQKGIDSKQLVEVADEALYHAKENGRDQVVSKRV